MSLDEETLKRGLKFFVGTWEVDYLVNVFSNNLEHISAADFKSKDGKDLTQISYEFFEDHTCKLKNGATGVEESGTWKQVSSDKFEFTLEKVFGEMSAEALKELQKVEKDMDGGFVFSLGPLVVRMKKTAEGVVTEVKKPDIGDLEPTEEDLKMKAIVGRWKVYKAFACVKDDFGLFTRADVEAEIERLKAAGEEDDAHSLQEMVVASFGVQIEFTEDHKMLTYNPIPPDVPQKEIDEAVSSGEFKVVDGMLLESEFKMWKAVKGDYWYDSEEKVEICGEKQSSWRKLTPDADGHIEYRMMMLEKA